MLKTHHIRVKIKKVVPSVQIGHTLLIEQSLFVAILLQPTTEQLIRPSTCTI
jgi:hypothetical protein